MCAKQNDLGPFIIYISFAGNEYSRDRFKTCVYSVAQKYFLSDLCDVFQVVV